MTKHAHISCEPWLLLTSPGLLHPTPTQVPKHTTPCCPWAPLPQPLPLPPVFLLLLFIQAHLLEFFLQGPSWPAGVVLRHSALTITSPTWILFSPCHHLMRNLFCLFPQCAVSPLFKLQTFKDAHMYSINVRHEWNCSLPSISYCWRSFSSTVCRLISLLQSVTLLASSLYAALYASCCTILLYIWRYCTVRFKMFSLFLFVFNVLCVWNVLETYYSTVLYSQLGFPGGTSGKEPTCQCRRPKGHRVQSLGQEDPLEEGMATHSSILAWIIPWTEEPGGLQSIGSQRVGHSRSDLAPTSQSWLDMESTWFPGLAFASCWMLEADSGLGLPLLVIRRIAVGSEQLSLKIQAAAQHLSLWFFREGSLCFTLGRPSELWVEPQPKFLPGATDSALIRPLLTKGEIKSHLLQKSSL